MQSFRTLFSVCALAVTLQGSFAEDHSAMLQVGQASSVHPSTLPDVPTLYCPSSADIAGGGTHIDGGWTEKGPNGVYIPAAFNLLGGYIEFDMDISKTLIGVNNNVYGVFPVWEGVYDG